MRIVIRDPSAVSSALRTHIGRRLGLALGRFGDRIAQVAVRFTDVTAGKRCEIQIALRPPTMCVDGVEADAAAALDHAGDLAARLIGRVIERERAQAGVVPPVEPRRKRK